MFSCLLLVPAERRSTQLRAHVSLRKIQPVHLLNALFLMTPPETALLKMLKLIEQTLDLSLRSLHENWVSTLVKRITCCGRWSRRAG